MMKKNKWMLTNKQINTFRVILDHIVLINFSPISTQITKHCLNENDSPKDTNSFNIELANKENNPVIGEKDLQAITKIICKL